MTEHILERDRRVNGIIKKYNKNLKVIQCSIALHASSNLRDTFLLRHGIRLEIMGDNITERFLYKISL